MLDNSGEEDFDNLVIVKIGGGAGINTDGIVRGLAKESRPVIVVLGANAVRDRIADKMGTPVVTIKSVSGYESVLSDQDAIDAIMMGYAGLARNRFVETCQQYGINAVGLSGLDGRTIQGERNRGIRTKENGRTLIKRDLSGKPKAINGKLIRMLMKNNYLPVLSIPIIDRDSVAINADNDNIIAVLHQEFCATHIYQFIEAPGLLAKLDDPMSLIEKLPAVNLKQQEATVKGRMRRKLLAFRKLLELGSTQIVIADGRGDSPYMDALEGKGTTIC